MQRTLDGRTLDQLQTENADLRSQLAVAEHRLRASLSAEPAAADSGRFPRALSSSPDAAQILAQFAETMSEIALAVSEDGRLAYCNASAALLFGYAPRGLLGFSLGDLVCPKDLPRLAELLAAASDTVSEGVLACRMSDESHVSLRLRVSRLTGTQGPMFCLVGRPDRPSEADRPSRADLRDSESPDSGEEGRDSSCLAARDRRVLIVGGDGGAVASLAGLLARSRVELAADLASALESVDARCPHLILFDLDSLEPDPDAIAHGARARAGGMQPTLAAVSASPANADRERALEAGFDAYLLKPVVRDDLDTLLQATPVGALDASPACVPASSIPVGHQRASGFALAADLPSLAAELESLGATLGAPSEPLRTAARALVHELAQPLNTAACYAVAARKLAAKSPDSSGSLCNALRGVDHQIHLAGVAMERLRGLLRGTVSDGEAGAEPPIDPPLLK